jgi:hypothetical protein
MSSRRSPPIDEALFCQLSKCNDRINEVKIRLDWPQNIIVMSHPIWSPALADNALPNVAVMASDCALL